MRARKFLPLGLLRMLSPISPTNLCRRYAHWFIYATYGGMKMALLRRCLEQVRARQGYGDAPAPHRPRAAVRYDETGRTVSAQAARDRADQGDPGPMQR